jgi:hypothetical protein
MWLSGRQVLQPEELAFAVDLSALLNFRLARHPRCGYADHYCCSIVDNALVFLKTILVPLKKSVADFAISWSANVFLTFFTDWDVFTVSCAVETIFTGLPSSQHPVRARSADTNSLPSSTHPQSKRLQS